MTENSCLNCRFWFREAFDQEDSPTMDCISECLRYPPTVYGYDWNTLTPQATNPETFGAFWCGEWQEATS